MNIILIPIAVSIPELVVNGVKIMTKQQKPNTLLPLLKMHTIRQQIPIIRLRSNRITSKFNQKDFSVNGDQLVTLEELKGVLKKLRSYSYSVGSSVRSQRFEISGPCKALNSLVFKIKAETFYFIVKGFLCNYFVMPRNLQVKSSTISSTSQRRNNESNVIFHAV